MKIIDAHMHLSHIEEFHRTARQLSGVNYSANGLLQEYADHNVVLGIGMGLTETKADGFPDADAINPMILDMADDMPASIAYCIGINPYQCDEDSWKRVERELQKPNAVGLKLYLGYYPFYAYDQVYDRVYELAAKYEVPVVFHCGDTYSERGLLKFHTH